MSLKRILAPVFILMLLLSASGPGAAVGGTSGNGTNTGNQESSGSEDRIEQKLRQFENAPEPVEGPNEQEALSHELQSRIESIQEQIERKAGIVIHGGVVGFYQAAGETRIGGEDIRNGSGAGVIADLQFSWKPPLPILDGGRFFMRVQTATGKGSDTNLGNLLFANLNSIADNTTDNAARLLEAYYAHEFFGGKLIVTAGKTEPVVFIDTNAFAANPNSQFVGKPFVNNPLFNSEDELGPIAAVSFSPFESITLTAIAASTSRPNDPVQDRKNLYGNMLDTPLVSVQLAYSAKFAGLQGHYRVFVWDATYEHVKLTEQEGADGTGGGVSIDQQITPKLGVFGRFGYGNSDAYAADWYWSTGVNLKGPIPIASRQQDELGIGIAGLKGSGGLESGTELHAEVYYRISISRHLALSPDIQFVANPRGDANGRAFLVGMLRTELIF